MGKSQGLDVAEGERFPRRLAIGGALIGVLLVGAAGYAWLGQGDRRVLSASLFGGPFSLTGPDGPVTQATMRGRYVLVYFGYTFCPDVCPTTLNTIVQALDRLGKRADDLRVLFITVDPARDTPEVMRDYTQAFSPRIVGLTGTAAQIAQVAAEYHVYYRIHSAAPGATASSVDHSSVLYLQGPDGASLGLIPADAAPDQMATEIAKYLPVRG